MMHNTDRQQCGDYWKVGGRAEMDGSRQRGENWEICNNVNNKLIKKQKRMEVAVRAWIYFFFLARVIFCCF